MTMMPRAAKRDRPARMRPVNGRRGKLRRSSSSTQLRRRGDFGRRNVFDATLDLMAPTFVTSPRNIAADVARMRFEDD